MRYAEAFHHLGYALDSPRQDWSAEKADGICITIWQRERRVKDGLPYLDLFELHPNQAADWTSKPGHRKRTRHLQRAVDEFEGRVDVIFVNGDPAEGYGDASPWEVGKRSGRHWTLSRFDPDTGFFRAEIAKPASTDAKQT